MFIALVAKVAGVCRHAGGEIEWGGREVRQRGKKRKREGGRKRERERYM